MGRDIFRTLFQNLILAAIPVLLWALAAHFLPPYLLPSPSRVFKTLFDERSIFFAAARFTTRNALSGAAIGVTLGVIIGYIAAYSNTLRWLVEPYLTILQSFPRESLFPLLIVWLGFGAITKIVNATLLSLFPIAVMTLNGLLDTRVEYVALMQSWGGSRAEEFRYCRLPALVPTLVSAVKVALPLALIGAVLGEFMGSSQGLGYIIVSSGSEFRVDRLFGAVVLLAFIGTTMLAVIRLIEKTKLQHFYQD